MATFMDDYLAGRAALSSVDAWIDEWHGSAADLSLDAFLGLTEEEGALFASDTKVLPLIVAARRGS